MQPRLVFSELSGTVYVVTRYRTEIVRGREIVVASVKYDVTDDFRRLRKQRVKLRAEGKA